MNKPTILSLGAMASVILALAVPSYNSLKQGQTSTGTDAATGTVGGRHWHCVTMTGPDAPNLIVLRDYGHFLKLIDHGQASDNGAGYDLQGRYDIRTDQLVAHMSDTSGVVYTDTFTVKRLEPDKMLMLQTAGATSGSASEETRYNCSALASRS